MQVDAFDGFGGRSVEFRSCADKMGAGQEREEVYTKRTSMRYDDDGHGNYVG